LNAQVLADIEQWLQGSFSDGSAREIGSGYQAAVHLIQRPAGAVIVKDARTTGPLAWLRRASLRREYKAYRMLAGVSGVPRCFGLLADRYLILDYVAGPSLRDAEDKLGDSEAFYAELLKLIQRLHACGVAHGDLKRKDNILVGPGEQPFIVDFGTAHFQHDQANPFRRWLFGFMRQTDYNAWIKRKYRRNYQRLSDSDRTLYRPLPLEVAVRWLREGWRQVTFRRLRKRLRARKRG
jgi:predicted Ser/Thr protein kinase